MLSYDSDDRRLYNRSNHDEVNQMSEFIVRPPNSGPPIAQDATMSVKFAQQVRILDPWYIMGGTKWSRTLFRLKHPVVYSKRGLRKLWRRIKYTFIKKPSTILCSRRKSGK